MFFFLFFKVGTASLCGDLKAFLSTQNLPKGKNFPALSRYRSCDFDSALPPRIFLFFMMTSVLSLQLAIAPQI